MQVLYSRKINYLQKPRPNM